MNDLGSKNNNTALNIRIPLRDLIKVYFKIGTVGFGGGYAVMNIIHSEFVEKHQWLTEQRYENILSLAEMAPGALTVNILAGIAYRLGGKRAMLFATAALITPSFFIILLLTDLFLKWQQSPIVKGAMEGLTAGVVGLLLSVVWQLLGKMPSSWFYYIICAMALGIGFFIHINPIWLVVFGGVLGGLKLLIEIFVARIKSRFEEGKK